MKPLYLLIWGFMCLHHHFLTAQQWGGRGQSNSITGRIIGSVIDSTTKSPVEFATIALRHDGTSKDIDGVISNDKGQFKLPSVKLGSYNLVISFIGYKSKTISGIKLTPKEPDFDVGEVILSTDEVVLDQVEVTAQTAVIENKIDRIVYNADKDASTVGGDAADVLRKVPMLSVDLEGNVSLRGSRNVQILLNGKPSGMFSNNAADALKMFPADQIKSVEVITTPGAKYDAEGTGGIINILTKKKSVQGYSATINGAVGTRQNRGSLNVSAAKGRFGMNGSGNVYYSWPQDARNSFYREDQVNGAQRILDQDGITNSSRIGFWGQAGAFYDFNAYNSINTSFSLRGHSFDQSGFQDALFTDPSLSINQMYRRDNTVKNLRSGYDWTTDYKKTYKEPEKEFSIAFQLNGTVSDDESTLRQAGNDPVLNVNENLLNDGLNLEATLQVDYVHPFSKKVKWEVGAKSVFRDIDSDYTYDVLDLDQAEYVRDPLRSDQFDYIQNVYAGYSSFTLKLGKDYGLVAGGRYERTHITGNFSDQESTFSNNYDNFVPSIILSRKFGFNTLKVSYVKRIQRPSLYYINPFVNSVDQRNVTFGNPLLAPEISNQYDIGYTSFNRGTVIATSLYYRRTTDVIQTILQVNQAGVSETSFQNTGVSNTLGFNIFTSFSIKKFWTLRGSVDIHSFNTKSESLQLENTAAQYKLFTSSSFDFGKGWKADLFGFANSPRQTLQGRVPSFSMMSLGIKKEIWNRKGSIGITMVDPFNETKRFQSELEGPTFFQMTDFRLPFRSFGLNFSYTMGKLDFKAKQRRSKIRNSDLKQGDGGAGQGGGTNTQN